MNEGDFYWLVGLLEGEGCFKIGTSQRIYKGASYRYAYPKITLRMTDLDVVERAAKLLGTPAVNQASRGKHKDVFECSISGSRAVAMMLRMLPHLGQRRQATVRGLLADAEANQKIMATRKTRSRRERRENPRGFVRLTASVSAA